MIREQGRQKQAELNGRRAWVDSDRVSEDERGVEKTAIAVNAERGAAVYGRVRIE